jgi:hypothetical protein
MRNLIIAYAFGTVLVLGAATAWKAEAATSLKAAAPAAAAATIDRTVEVRCHPAAPRDGCGRGWFRTRWGGCRPC